MLTNVWCKILLSWFMLTHHNFFSLVSLARKLCIVIISVPEQAFATGFLKCSPNALVLMHESVEWAPASAIDHYAGRLIGNSSVCAATMGDLRRKDHVISNRALEVNFTGWLRNIFLCGRHTRASLPIKFERF